MKYLFSDLHLFESSSSFSPVLAADGSLPEDTPLGESDILENGDINTTEEINADDVLLDVDEDDLEKKDDDIENIVETNQNRIDTIVTPSHDLTRKSVDIERIEQEADEKMDTFLASVKNQGDVDRIKRVQPFWKKWLRRGKPIQKNALGASGPFLGVETVEEYRKKTRSIAETVEQTLTPLSVNAAQIKPLSKRFQNIQALMYSYQDDAVKFGYSLPDNYQKLETQSQEVDQKIKQIVEKDIIQGWKEKRPFIRGKIQEIQSELDPEVLEITDFYETEKKYMDSLDELIDQIQQERDTKKAPFKNTTLIDTFLDQLARLNDFAHLDDIVWKTKQEQSVDEFQNGQKTLDYLDNNDFFNPEKRETVLDDLKTRQQEYGLKIDKYKNILKELEKRVQKDIQILDARDFEKKYGKSPYEFEQHLKQYIDNRDILFDFWETLKEPHYFDRFAESYERFHALPEHDDEYDKARADALQYMNSWRSFEENMNVVDTATNEITEFLKDRDENVDIPLTLTNAKEVGKDLPLVANQQWKKINTWLTQDWYFYSLSDVYKMVKTSVEAFKRREERRSEKAQSRLGMNFWDKAGRFFVGDDTADIIASEFQRRLEEANSKRVGEFEEAYQNMKAWEIWRILDKTNDLDQGQACLNKLNESGNLKWDDPVLWNYINRMKGYNYLKLDDLDTLSMDKITAKVKAALSDMYSIKEFDSWHNSLESNSKSAREKYEQDFRNDGAELHTVMQNMLKEWKNSEEPKTGSPKFEHYIRASLEQGKMNGSPDKRFYYLILGATVKNKYGQTILSRSRLASLADEMMPTYAHIEFFGDTLSHKKNGWIVPKDTPGAKTGPWTYEDIQVWHNFLTLGGNDTTFNPDDPDVHKRMQKFWYQNVHMSENATDRVRRNQRNAAKTADHDDAWAYFMEWTDEQVKIHLQAQSSGEGKSSADFWRNFVWAFPEYAVNMYQYIKEGDKKWEDAKFWKEQRKQILLQVGSRLKLAMISLQSLAGNYRPVEKGFFTFTKSMWEQPESGYSKSMVKARDRVNAFMGEMFDEVDQGATNEKYRKTLTYNGYEHAPTFDVVKSIDSQKEINEEDSFVADHKDVLNANKKLLSNDSSEGGGRYFNNVDAIEKVLERYVKTVDSWPGDYQ